MTNKLDKRKMSGTFVGFTQTKSGIDQNRIIIYTSLLFLASSSSNSLETEKMATHLAGLLSETQKKAS